MNSTSPDVIANDVEHLTRRVAAMEAKLEAVMKTQYWQMGAAVGVGSVLTLLLPKISAALGLS
jgi:hypothetical protein